ncbi:hypothetical protein FPI77_23790 [Klebsiella quasivariicola]|nr:hypothetical protein [Klebsiella quasivariicola]MBE8770161.1 hypothetical protein [Klebsiella quasipneumoniae]TTM52700.1 hypothetical protein FPI77_23790 [Klebsiella quasivariicola]
MTTDITELAQREKFEAWFVNDVVGADVNFPAFKDGEYTEGEIYDEQLYFMLQAMWMAWKAAGAEMVEALGKAQETIAFQQGEIKALLSSLESRTVKLPDLRQIVSGDRYVWSDGVYNYSQDVKVALAAAGIKVEDE